MSLYSTFIASSSSTVPLGTPIYVLRALATVNPSGSQPSTLLGGTYVKAGATYPIASYPDLAAHIGVAWPSANANVVVSTGTSAGLNALLYSSGVYVAAMDNGTIRRSTDAITWNTHTAAATQLYDLVYGDKYVVCGNAGNIFTSTDGITWSAATSGVAVSLNGIAYGNGLYIIVTGSGTSRKSTDGITWSAGGSITSAGVKVVFDGAQFVAAVSAANTNNIKTSTDGTAWTSRSAPIAAPLCLAYGGGYYVAGTTNGNVAVSTDAITWVAVNAKTTTQAITDMVYSADFGFFAGLGGSTRPLQSPEPTTLWYETQITPASTVSIVLSDDKAVVGQSNGSITYVDLYDASVDFYVPTGTFSVPALTGQTNNWTNAELAVYVKATT